MGKEYEKRDVSRIVLKSVDCDQCGEGCTNTFFDILTKGSFSDNYNLIETVCYNCWGKKYRASIEQKNKESLFAEEGKDE